MLLGSGSLAACEFEVRLVTVCPEVIEDWGVAARNPARSDPHRLQRIRGTLQTGPRQSAPLTAPDRSTSDAYISDVPVRLDPAPLGASAVEAS
jgi:hypothetical protein